MSQETDEQKALRELKSYFHDIALGKRPRCQIAVTFKQVGRCIYGSCGCRLYQGQLPKTTRGTPKAPPKPPTPIGPRYTTTLNPATGLHQVVKQ